MSITSTQTDRMCLAALPRCRNRLVGFGRKAAGGHLQGVKQLSQLSKDDQDPLRLI